MKRIVRNSVLAAIALVVVYWFVWLYETGFRDPRFFDGWVLVACIVVLTLFNVRKKLAMLPLGKAAAWMQAHIYAGWIAVGTFALHTELSLPDAPLEWALWVVFLIVALSGVIGVYLTRSLPPKLEAHEERVLFERIPQFRSQLAREVGDLAIGSVNEAGSMTISDLYINTLHEFFARPQNLLLHLRGSRRPLIRICSEIDKLERYLDATGKEILARIKNCVITKDALDFQYANQGALKFWLFIHIPATYGLITLAIAHIAVMYAYSSGVP